METVELAPNGVATHEQGVIFVVGEQMEKAKYPFVCHTGEGEQMVILEKSRKMDTDAILNRINGAWHQQVKLSRNDSSGVVMCTVLEFTEDEAPMRNKLAEMIANRLKITSFGDVVLGAALFCRVEDLVDIEL